MCECVQAHRHVHGTATQLSWTWVASQNGFHWIVWIAWHIASNFLVDFILFQQIFQENENLLNTNNEDFTKIFSVMFAISVNIVLELTSETANHDHYVFLPQTRMLQSINLFAHSSSSFQPEIFLSPTRDFSLSNQRFFSLQPENEGEGWPPSQKQCSIRASRRAFNWSWNRRQQRNLSLSNQRFFSLQPEIFLSPTREWRRRVTTVPETVLNTSES